MSPRPGSKEIKQMKNPFTEVEIALVDSGKWIAGDISKIDRLLTAGKTLAPETVAAVVKFVSDTQTLISLAATSVGASGLNFAADSAAYEQFLIVKDDVVSLAGVIETDVKAL
jgi:hypothetical protein